MQTRRMLLSMGMVLLGCCGPVSHAQEPVTPTGLKADIGALKVNQVAWREIDWQPCLLEGLRQAKAQGKPALLWIFIDRPADDARC